MEENAEDWECWRQLIRLGELDKVQTVVDEQQQKSKAESYRRYDRWFSS